jgi:hypothetical protein
MRFTPDSQPGIYRFTFEGEDTENTFVNAAQRLETYEPFERIDDAERELAERQRALGSKGPLAKPGKVFFAGISRKP